MGGVFPGTDLGEISGIVELVCNIQATFVFFPVRGTCLKTL
jgi:hypothetical protein